MGDATEDKIVNEIANINLNDDEQASIDELFSIDELKTEAQGELLDTVMEKFLPKLKLMIPKAIKMVDQDHDLMIKLDEMICVWRDSDTGEMQVMKGLKNHIIIEVSEENMEHVEVNDLTALFDMFLDIIKKNNKKG